MASSSSSLPRWKYDVFLSFRGEDTRKNFVDHLYMALHQKGIYTFKDDEKLERGKSISPELLKAIKKSRIAVIIFSENYASSSWCLDELVEIIQCKNTGGQTILPVFYNVDPSQVRNQKKSFAEAFGEHEETFRKENDKVQRWRAALKEVANLSGWNLETTENGHEAKFIQKIVGETLKVLGRLPFNVAKYGVGIDCRVDKVITLLDSALKEVRIVGICGIGGLGKTTIAKAVFNQIFDQFESFHFLGNVREESKKHDLPYLQQQLLKGILKEEDLWIRDVDYRINVIKQRLYHKKVLVVLDDVDDVMQLKSLAGGNDWFGFGSRIIVTTRNERLLVDNKVDHVIYRVEGLNHDEALQLFSWHAFNRNHPKEDYLKLSHSIKDYTKGLPLALEVLGSLLFGRSIKEWEHELDNLKSIPNMEIHDVLKRSYDGLNDTEKDVFLDIACFFNGYDKDYVMDILSSTGFHPRIVVLIERSLITISYTNELLMHDLIEEMGKEIVRQESPDDPGKRSRLWFYKDICKVLEDNMATESIKGIMLKWPHDHTVEELHINVDAFVKMKRLKFLKLSGVIWVCGPITYLSNELCYFDWDGCPISFLPSNFRPRNLVHLNLPCSQIEQICFSVKLEHLKFLNLSDSPYFKKTPDLSYLPCLENLDLNGCTNLIEVQLSSGVHERLVAVNLSGCKNLMSLPRSIKLKKLKYFYLSECSKLEKFSEIQGDMECLGDLNLKGTAIRELPESIIQLPKLSTINLTYCRSLRSISSLPSSIRNVFAHGCESLESYWFPPSVGSPDRRRFVFSECHKLVMEQRNSISNDLLESQLQKIGQITIPGSDIPHWFKHKSEGESISVCLPVGHHNNVKGIVVCAAFEGHLTNWDRPSFPQISLYLKVNGYEVNDYEIADSNFFEIDDSVCVSNHIFLCQRTEYDEEYDEGGMEFEYDYDEDVMGCGYYEGLDYDDVDVMGGYYEGLDYDDVDVMGGYYEGLDYDDVDVMGGYYEGLYGCWVTRPIKNLMQVIEGQHQDGCYIEASITFDDDHEELKVKKMGILLVMEEEEKAESTSEQGSRRTESEGQNNWESVEEEAEKTHSCYPPTHANNIQELDTLSPTLTPEGKQEKRPCSAQHNTKGFFDALVSCFKCLLYQVSDDED